jgi:hypothetical protein
MATTKIRSSSIEDGQVANVDLSATIAVTGGQIADDAITTAKILDDNVTLAKMAGLARGSIILGDASGDPSAKPLGVSTHVLTSDGSDADWAAIPAAASAANVPAFSVYVAAAWDLVDATWVLVPWDTADINDDGASGTCFNITGSGTNPRGFTVPAGEAGRYQFNYLTGNYSISGDLEVQATTIYKGVSGGAATAYACENYWSFWINNSQYTLSGSTILDLAVGDHLYVYTYNAVGGTGGRIAGGRKRCIFSGMKLT